LELTLTDRPTDEGGMAPEDDVTPGEPEPPVQYGRFDRVRTLAERVQPPRTMRGLIVVIAVVGAIGTLVAVGGLKAMEWTETEGFCSKCHTMAPESKAYSLSVHRDVACAECHVKPGLSGLIEAKLNGAKQTLEVLLGSFPKPIPAPDHSKLPDPKDTCMKCHSLGDIAGDGNPTKIIVRPRFRDDKENTRETVAVVVRPPELGAKKGAPGAHWHVKQKVEFVSPDEQSRKIDWVGVTYRDGRRKQFIARPQINVSSDVRPDVRRLMENETVRRMSCIDCHNRVGHEIPTPDEAIDEAIAAGKISQGLPYIKREGIARVDRNYPSVEEAKSAIAGIRGLYAAEYPLVARTRRAEVNRAVKELKLIYGLVATPNMRAVAATYPNNLGHQTSRGCFRCHDGNHYQVTARGRVLKKTIPWECTTCHTFPQVGRRVSSVSLLGQPRSHRDRLWVFNHKYDASSLDASGTGGFCSNCHNTGAAKVDHDEMLYRHPAAIEKAGLRACRFCHQAASCARCHKKPVLNSNKVYNHRREDLLGERR
jgi:nitrate/TMAO reductase-like tetraheme cytochrome c subunit